VALLGLSYRTAGWGGVAIAGGALVMWLLLHFNHMLQVLRRAANQPIGHVGSAVMLNARLRPGVTLLHVVAMTRSLGQRISTKDAQPEQYRWLDASQSQVTCDFHGGKLKKWALVRPLATGPAPTESSASPAP
jgi:hypothetical protein